MRRVDRWAGVPVCVFLTILRTLGDLRLRPRPAKPRPVARILFVKLAEQGAMVLAYPAIRRAAEMVGRQNVHFLVFEENRFILDLMQIMPEENVVTIPAGGLVRLLGGTIRALRRLRRLQPDATVDLEFFARSSAALAYLSGAGVRVGLHGFGDGAPYRGDLMTHRVRYDPTLHTTDAFDSMVEAIRVSPDQLPEGLPKTRTREDELPIFRPAPDERSRVEAVVAKEAGTGEYSPLVLLNANASDLLPLRRWPAERYVELSRRLLERSDRLHVAFTGAPSEAVAAEKLVAAVGSSRCFSMAGKTTLRELLVLYCLADVLVTNDSGPAHFATLTPIEVVTLFGPETPALFGARSPRNHVVYSNLACSPCVNAYNNRLSACTDNQCMQEITVEEVLGEVCRILRI